MKICSRCRLLKSHKEYRWRTEKRSKSYPFCYPNSTCKKCDSELSKERHMVLKNDEEYKIISRERAKKSYQKNRTKNLLAAKQYRLKDSSRERRKEYISENKGKIKQQEDICKKRYFNYHRDNLTDQYIIWRLIGKMKLDKKIIKEMPELIEAKRAQLKLLRSLQN